jgi:DNA-binding transcriptional MerR regulator
MLDPGSNQELSPIPAKRYFTIGEVSELCNVKPHVLRYWEQEFSTLKPVKRRGNRRYYQRHDVLVIRQIHKLLYEQGFTIAGARQRIEAEQDGAAMTERKAVKSATPVAVIRELREELEQVLLVLGGNRDLA